MSSTFEFCIPTTGTKVPSEPEWFHEIKYDSFRLCVERNGDRVRLITRGGYDWAKRFPWIAESALQNRYKHFVIDGEAVILGVDGISDFNALHSGKQNDQVQLFAFDVLAMEGDDLRDLPLSMTFPKDSYRFCNEIRQPPPSWKRPRVYGNPPHSAGIEHHFYAY
jgi:ATP-dependent DNA ligase